MVIASISLVLPLGYGVDDDTNIARVTIHSEDFVLEVADEPHELDAGLSGRSDVDIHGGMIFVFAVPQWHEFVMRDCAHPLDILYLDDAGYILTLYEMHPESPRNDAERADEPMGQFAYISRLTPYPSRVPAQFAIELQGGTIMRLGLAPGDRVLLDTAALLANMP